MSEFMPHFAPVIVLLFLGTVLLVGASLLVLFYGAACRSSFFTRLGGGSALTIAAGYFILLGGVSFASSEEVLPPGRWSIFARSIATLPIPSSARNRPPLSARRCNRSPRTENLSLFEQRLGLTERTISAHRGNAALTPNSRKVILIDDAGRSFAPSPEGQTAFTRPSGISTPLTQPLRPGESYTTDFVFDVPKDARELRLLITEDDPETRLLSVTKTVSCTRKSALALVPLHR